ncbi:MAG: 3-isopropylmalate dehydratase small subunit [Proteobacteria bacterium]|nr:3-isopropylmalate dehydratase small subunit [Pseudomonadota bacterium]
MEKFTTLSGTAAPMALDNIDTDMIIPKQFLKTIKRSGLGKVLFNDTRFNPDGTEKPDFVLNQPQYRNAKILVTGGNFGCGSSREHAPWSLADFGIHCVISTSFADIFFNNCAKNGILLITLPQSGVDQLMKDAHQAGTLNIDLEAQTVTRPDGSVITFDVEPFRKHNLLNGLDDIGLTLRSAGAIDAYEKKLKAERPWL